MMTPPRKKEIVAMRNGVAVLIATLVIVGCAHMDIDRKGKALAHIKPGDTQAHVFKTVGPPDIRHDVDDRRFVAYYQTQLNDKTGQPVTTDLCTAVSFENGKVVVVGEDLTERWAREEEARKRSDRIAARVKRQEEASEAARRQARIERQEKIKALEDEVRPVPASNAALNLKLYRQLLALDPNNPRYLKKVDLYQKRLSQQQKSRKEQAARAAKRRELEAWEKAREKRNVKLRQYSGNGIAEMAIHDMGNGSLYVWVKNVSFQIITTHPDHFTLIDKDNRKVKCKVSESLDSVLEPGSISHGRIEYNPAIIPRELIFENNESGRVAKSFE
jgi:hypothetical protein